jgi:hypothetical protein
MRYDHFSMLPERAFQPRGGFRAGGMTLEGGSSGGGGSPQPTSTSQTTIPEYAQPYMERLLGKSEAASEAPYQTYGGERLTGPTQEQQAARTGVAGLQQPGQFGMGTGLATLGGLSAIGYGGQAAGAGQQYMGMATSPQAQQAFMSPYMQNVVDVQRQEAIRSAQMGNLAQNLGAARQGTYGGARQTLAQTERERNLGQQLAQIQATGSQKAFEAAQQAQQFGSQLGLQGLQAGIGASGQAAQTGATLGQLGIGQQQTDLARLGAQEQFGALGQREQQAALDLAYQDFLAQQRYPYSQLGFMSDILRGSGNLAGTGGTALYQAPPSTGSQLLGLASTLGGAYLAGGAPKLFKEGGEVSGLGAIQKFNVGGPIQQQLDVAKLDAEQIEQTRATPARNDVPDIVLLAELEAKLAEMKRLQAGMAQAPQTTAAQDIRQEAQQVAGLDAIPVDDNYFMSEEEAMASGGIVAFANGGMSMDPGMPYGLGYYNNMGYENGGVVAFQDGGESMFGMTPMGEPTGIGLPQMIDTDPARLRGASRLQLYPLMTPEQQAEFEATGEVPAAFLESETAKKFSAEKRAEIVPKKKEAAAEKEPEKAPKKAPQPKAEMSDKTIKKIEKTEDSYEKALRKELEGSGMTEEAKREALGFALMKFGAKAMQARKGQEGEAYGKGVEDAASTYMAMLNNAKKDKRQLTKDLAEYGLAKEKLGVEREKVAATRDTAAATREATLASRMIAAQQKQQEMANKIMEEYFKPGNPISIPGTDNYIPPQLYLKRRLELIGAADRGAPTTAQTPVEGRAPFDPRQFPLKG